MVLLEASQGQQESVVCFGNSKGEVLLMFSKPISIRDLNEVEVLAILEALRINLGLFSRKANCGK